MQIIETIQDYISMGRNASEDVSYWASPECVAAAVDSAS